MCLEKLKRFELVELPVPSGATGRIVFPNTPQLRNQSNQYIIFKGIEVFTEDVYLNSQQTNTIPGLPVSEISKMVLVLYVNGEESVKMIPLARMINIQGQVGVPFRQIPFVLEDLTNIDLDKSYVQFSSAASSQYVIPFGFTYLRLVQDPTPGSNNFIQG